MDVLDSESAREIKIGGLSSAKDRTTPVIRAANMATLGYSLEAHMPAIDEELKEGERRQISSALGSNNRDKI